MTPYDIYNMSEKFRSDVLFNWFYISNPISYLLWICRPFIYLSEREQNIVLKTMLEGVVMTQTQLLNVFAKSGITKVCFIINFLCNYQFFVYNGECNLNIRHF